MPRRKLPSGIYQFPNGGDYYCRPYDRKNKKKGRLFRDPDLAVVIKHKEEVEKGLLDPNKREWTCDEWVEFWTTDKGFERPKQSTNAHNRERVKQFGEDFAGIPLNNVTRAQARKWANKHPGRVSAVKTMLNDALREDILNDNPFAHIKVPKGPGRKYIKPMTPEEIQQLAQVAYDKWPDWPVMGDMILLCAYTGLRRGELLGLKWDDVDFEKGVLHVQRQYSQKTRALGPTKNGRDRLVPLFPIALDVLRRTDRHQSPDGEMIWYSPRGKRIEPALLDYYWRQAREKFLGGIRVARAQEIELDLHTLRHFFISWLVDKGVQPHDIAGFVGHEDGGRLVQELYGHLYSDNAISRAMSAVLAA